MIQLSAQFDQDVGVRTGQSHEIASSSLRDIEREFGGLNLRSETVDIRGMDNLRIQFIRALSVQNEAAQSALRNAKKEFETVSSKLRQAENERDDLKTRVLLLTEAEVVLVQENEKLKKEVREIFGNHKHFYILCFFY